MLELGRYVTLGAAGHLERFTQRILLSEELLKALSYMGRTNHNNDDDI